MRFSIKQALRNIFLRRPQLLIWGGTGQMRVLADIAEQNGYEIVCIVDNRELNLRLSAADFVRGPEGLRQWLLNRKADAKLHGAVAIGGASGKDRLALLEELKSLQLVPVTLIHSTAKIAGGVVIDCGSQVLMGAALAVNVKLGAGVIVNTNAVVDHDCELSRGVHVGPGATIAGEVSVGAHSFVGAGATILPKLKVGADVIIGAGSVVTSDVRDGMTVVGAPARPLT